jgi:hypothetical protein
MLKMDWEVVLGYKNGGMVAGAGAGSGDCEVAAAEDVAEDAAPVNGIAAAGPVAGISIATSSLPRHGLAVAVRAAVARSMPALLAVGWKSLACRWGRLCWK